jgi:hypothetical protein
MATAEHIIPRILDKPPNAKGVWSRDECDAALSCQVEKTQADSESVSEDLMSAKTSQSLSMGALVSINREVD